MSTLGQFITLLLVIGVVGAYFWPVPLHAGGRVSVVSGRVAHADSPGHTWRPSTAATRVESRCK